MYKYTICFIKKGDEILLQNREKPSWMGSWNGIGGKFEEGETPKECIIREVFEETGIELKDVVYRGNVTWNVDNVRQGGMYLFFAEVDKNFDYPTPIKMDEGILDWKKIDWILNSDNSGIAANIHYYLPHMLQNDGEYEYHCIFKDKVLVGFEMKEVEMALV